MELDKDSLYPIGEIGFNVHMLDHPHRRALLAIINVPDTFDLITQVERVGEKIRTSTTKVEKNNGVTDCIAMMFEINPTASRIINKKEHDVIDIENLSNYARYLKDMQFAFPFAQFIEEHFPVEVINHWKQAYGYARYEGRWWRLLCMMPDETHSCDGGTVGAEMLFRARFMGAWIEFDVSPDEA